MFIYIYNEVLEGKLEKRSYSQAYRNSCDLTISPLTLLIALDYVLQKDEERDETWGFKHLGL